MANFEAHIQQAASNLSFLEEVNKHSDTRFDWQVTIVFYTALHLINAHIAKKINKNYLSHKQVSEILDFENQMSLARVNKETFLAYDKLYRLSRRSRYLLRDNYNRAQDIQENSLTYGVHLRKAVRHLNMVMGYMHEEYQVVFSKPTLTCVDFKNEDLGFIVLQSSF